MLNLSAGDHVKLSDGEKYRVGSIGYSFGSFNVTLYYAGCKAEHLPQVINGVFTSSGKCTSGSNLEIILENTKTNKRDVIKEDTRFPHLAILRSGL